LLISGKLTINPDKMHSEAEQFLIISTLCGERERENGREMTENTGER
jgi:hypothetical protein